jgi:flagellin
LGDYTEATAGDNIVVGQDADGNDVVMDAGNIETSDTSSSEPALYQNTGTDGVSEFFVEEGGAYYAATIDTDQTSDTYGQVSYDTTTAATNGDVTTGTLADLAEITSGVVSDPEDAIEIDVSSLDAEVYAFQDGSGYVVQGQIDGQDVYYEAEVNQDTGGVTLGDQLTADPLASLDSALNTVDSLRSELGAVQNRFEDAITNLSTNETNLAAARSRIEDADYAMEVADMTRSQILQQAGTSVLAQANQLPQNVLSLLG